MLLGVATKPVTSRDIVHVVSTRQTSMCGNLHGYLPAVSQANLVRATFAVAHMWGMHITLPLAADAVPAVGALGVAPCPPPVATIAEGLDVARLVG